MLQDASLSKFSRSQGELKTWRLIKYSVNLTFFARTKNIRPGLFHPEFTKRESTPEIKIPPSPIATIHARTTELNQSFLESLKLQKHMERKGLTPPK